MLTLKLGKGGKIIGSDNGQKLKSFPDNVVIIYFSCRFPLDEIFFPFSLLRIRPPPFNGESGCTIHVNFRCTHETCPNFETRENEIGHSSELDRTVILL